jgi:hypothetical protein
LGGIKTAYPYPMASWFETALKKRLLTMRVQDLILKEHGPCTRATARHA